MLTIIIVVVIALLLLACCVLFVIVIKNTAAKRSAMKMFKKKGKGGKSKAKTSVNSATGSSNSPMVFGTTGVATNVVAVQESPMSPSDSGGLQQANSGNGKHNNLSVENGGGKRKRQRPHAPKRKSAMERERKQEELKVKELDAKLQRRDKDETFGRIIGDQRKGMSLMERDVVDEIEFDAVSDIEEGDEGAEGEGKGEEGRAGAGAGGRGREGVKSYAGGGDRDGDGTRTNGVANAQYITPQ